MNRLWLRSSLMLLCVVQLFATSHSCRADEHAAAEKLLPKETLAFFTISDMPELEKKWGKTSMGQLFQDPQLKPFLDDISKKKDELSGKLEDEVGVSIDELLELPQGELTFALLEVPARTLSVVMMLEYGDSQDTIDKLLKKMDDGLEKESAEHSTEDIEDVKVHIYKLKNDDPDSPLKTLVYFTDESYLVLSNELDAIKEVLKRWDGDSDDTLAENDQYKYIQTQCKIESGEPLVKLFLSPIGLIQTGIAMAQTSIPQIGMAAGFLPMLGIDGLKGYGGAMSFDEGDFESIANFFIFSETPKGLVGIFNFPAAQLSPPKWVPADVASYLAANWNILGAYTSIETLVDSFQGRGTTARFLDSIADQGPMIHPKKDLLDHLDGKIHFIQNEPKEAEDDAPPIPSLFVGLGLKDAAKMKKTLSAAAKAGASNMETREFGGETIYEVSPSGGDQVISITVAENLLIVTNDTPMLEGVMRGEAGRGATLIDAPDYKRAAKVFPAKTSMQAFQRSEAQLKLYYNMLKNAEGDTIEGIDVSKLPPFEAISKYLLPSASYTVPDKKGAKSVSFTLKRAE